ncbi:MAG: 1,4-dihydroxy-2-naphthoate octaprenyltransferase [Verrucomicrobiales bacterium]
MKAWILAMRPKTLPAAIVPVWAGCVMAWHLSGAWRPDLAAWTLVGALAIQIATNFFNDAVDADKGADTEKRLGPRRVTAGGMMSRRAVYGWGLAFLALATLCGLVLWAERGWWVVAMGLPSLFLTYGYTGGPFPLAYRGMGELFVILFFGLVAVGGTVFVQLGEWREEAFWLGWQVGMLSAVLIAINNLRDREEDAGSGKRTLAVRFGANFMRALIALLLLGPYLLLPMTMPIGVGLLLLVVPGLLWAASIFRGVRRAEGKALNGVLARAGLHLLLFVLLFWAGLAWGAGA